MGSFSTRERVAFVFMTMSVIATLVLGAVLAAQLGATPWPAADPVRAPASGAERTKALTTPTRA